MSDPGRGSDRPAPAPDPERGSDRPAPAPAPWWFAARRGSFAFVCVALAALGIGVLEWLALGRPFGLRLAWKLAGLYVGAFHGAGVRARGEGVFGVDGSDGAGALVSPTGATLHVTFLLGTALAVLVLWRAGRAVAYRAGGSWRRRIAWGAAVAPVYALLVFCVSLVVVLRFPAAGIGDVRLVGWEALVRSLVLAAVAGAAGGFASARADLGTSDPWAARVVAWIVGGSQMTVALLVLAFAGFLVVAAVETDASTAYVRGLAGRAGAIAAGHHALSLPNQSFLVAVPAMGGCVEVDGSGSQPTTVCLRELRVRPGWGDLVFPGRSTELVALSPAWMLFVLVPAAATIWGGRVAAAHAPPRAERVLRGGGAGVVFAALTFVGVAVSAVSVTGSSGDELLRLGADPTTTASLALAWGVIGGVMGAALPDPRQEPVGVTPPAEGVPEPEPDPPSPTSL